MEMMMLSQGGWHHVVVADVILQVQSSKVFQSELASRTLLY